MIRKLLLSEHILCKEKFIIMKKFDFEILTYFYVLRSPEFIYTIPTVMHAYMCVWDRERLRGKYLALYISKTNKDTNTKCYAKYQINAQIIFPILRENPKTGSYVGWTGYEIKSENFKVTLTIFYNSIHNHRFYINTFFIFLIIWV